MVVENEGISCRQIETCELCAEQGKVLYSNLRDQLFSAPGTWAIRACPKCALLWSDPQPFPDQIHKLYRTYYTHSSSPQFSSFRSRGKAKLVKDALAKTLFWKPYIFQSDNLHLQGLPPGDLIEVAVGAAAFSLPWLGKVGSATASILMSRPLPKLGRSQASAPKWPN
jgi:hypothetical protein